MSDQTTDFFLDIWALSAEFKDWQENSQLPLAIAEYRKAELMKVIALLGILNDALSAFSFGLLEIAWVVL